MWRMQNARPTDLDVEGLLDQPGSRGAIEFDAVVPELRAGLAEVAGDVHLDLVLEALDGGVLVRGELSGESMGQCRRCLKPVAQPFSVQGSEIYRPPTDVWEEGYSLKDGTIDLEPMARDLIGLELPTSPLCRPDCKGLCSRCGADLNEGPCACGEEIDLRWSALKNLAVPSATPERSGGAEGNGGSSPENR
jgi:uncharacterized protein